ncbi:MAG: glycerol-3-phosphate 1-O-acyltransferase PlsY [Verrucomicrobiota bacterium]
MTLLSEIFTDWWPALLAYVVGATPFGFLAGKLKGIDIRDHGSGNIGATNVLRTLGKPIGITVLVFDVAKGMVPVIIAKIFSDSSLVHIATAAAAILGHNYTFWLRFKGGKGIATTGGAIAPIIPIALVSAVLLWIIFLRMTRYVSVASLVAAITIPSVVAIESLIRKQWDLPVLFLAIFVCILAFWKHRANIGRLRRGEENRFQRKSSAS